MRKFIGFWIICLKPDRWFFSSSVYDMHSNGSHDWSDYSFLSKRSAHQSILLSATPHLHAGHALIFDYQNGLQAHAESLHGGSQRGGNDERDFRSEPRDSSRIARPAASAAGAGPGNDEDWRNIHSMLTCISGMVEKTKRAISILQQRGVEPHPSQDTAVTDMRRQTEEKIAEFRRNAEDAVNQVSFQYFFTFFFVVFLTYRKLIV